MRSGFIMCAVLLLASIVACTSPDTGSRPEGQAAEKLTFGFDRDREGSLPLDLGAEVGEWRVVGALDAPSPGNALGQFARNERPVFNVALVAGRGYADVDISVKLKPVAGEIDQGGGVVWRAADASNYYIARYNPLEDNYRAYKVVDGKRTELASADVGRESGWRSLRVIMRGARIQCHLDAVKYLDVEDTTFPESGSIGLWTKADAQTLFDDLEVGPAGAMDR